VLSVRLKTFCSGPAETNAYLLTCSDTKKTAIIDAPLDSLGPLLNEIKKESLHVEMILLTHSHWDHIADCHPLQKALGIPLYVHQKDAKNVENPGADGLPLFFPIEPSTVDGFLIEGQKIALGNLTLEVIHTPGHTPGGVCFYLQNQNTLLSGDTLFQRCMGRIDLPTASAPSVMWASLHKLSLLPKETIVYPGHGDPTSIGKEAWIADAEKKFGKR